MFDHLIERRNGLQTGAVRDVYNKKWIYPENKITGRYASEQLKRDLVDHHDLPTLNEHGLYEWQASRGE